MTTTSGAPAGAVGGEAVRDGRPGDHDADHHPAPDTVAVPRLHAAIAGVVGVGAALAVGELLAGLFDTMPSLVDAVGTLVVDNVPTAVKDLAIRLFGTADKVALGVGTVLVALGVGAATGVGAARDRDVGTGVFVLFALFGLVMAMVQPLVNPVVVVLGTAVALASGLAVLRGLLALAGRAPRIAARRAAPAVADATVGDQAPGVLERRVFLARAGGAAAGVAATGLVGRTLSSVAVVDVTDVDLDLGPAEPAVVPAPALTAAQVNDAVDGISPLVTPLDEFYRIDTALAIPNVDVTDWTLRLHGLVDREVELTYDQLASMDQFEAYLTIACVSNEVGGDLIGNALWQGVRLSQVLDLAGVQDAATQIAPRSIDGWTAGFPTAAAYDGRDAMVALRMDGEPLPRRHGFPARLVVPGLYGYVSATKWLSEVELTTWEGFDSYWVPRGWAKEGPVRTQSRIDTPRDGRRVPAGPLVVAGVAWAMGRGISRVEVAVDGDDWVDATTTEPVSDDVWVQWWVELDLPDGNHLVRVRATDGDGETQTEQPSPVAPDGATGYHSIRFTSTSA